MESALEGDEFMEAVVSSLFYEGRLNFRPGFTKIWGNALAPNNGRASADAPKDFWPEAVHARQ